MVETQRGVRHQSSSRGSREVLRAEGRMGQQSWLPIKNVFIMGQRGRGVDRLANARSSVLLGRVEMLPHLWSLVLGMLSESKH